MDPSQSHKLSILLVEDDVDYAYSVIRSLEKNYKLDHCPTEAEALRLLYINSYDILLLDLNLSTGYLSGFHLLDYLRRLERFNDLVIIGISGMSADDIHSNESFCKLNAFLLKPVPREVLIATIQKNIHPDLDIANENSQAEEEL